MRLKCGHSCRRGIGGRVTLTRVIPPLIWALAVGALPVCAQDTDNDAAASDDSAENGKSSLMSRILPEATIHGRSTTWYRGRWNGDVDDQDFYQQFLIDARDLIPEHLDAEVSLRLHEDFSSSGSPYSFADDPLLDIDNARDEDWPDRINTAWADLHGSDWGDISLRAGRQYLYEFDGLHIDGAHLRAKPWNQLEFTAFGGRPVTYYSGTHGDSAFGLSSTLQAARNLKLRAKYYRYSDDDRDIDDDQAEIEFWTRSGQWGYFHGSLGTLDSDLKDMILDAKLVNHDWDAYLILRYYRLLTEIEDHTIEFSPYFAVLDELEPFGRAEIRANKRFGSLVDLFAGAVIRRDDTSGDSDGGDLANTDYERYDAGFSVYPIDKLTLTATGEYWDVESGRRFSGVSGEITYDPLDELRLSIGNAYGEYRYEYYDTLRQLSFKERPDVTTYFASVRWRVSKSTTFRTKFEIEDSDEEFDSDTFYRLRMSLGYRF